VSKNGSKNTTVRDSIESRYRASRISLAVALNCKESRVVYQLETQYLEGEELPLAVRVASLETSVSMKTWFQMTSRKFNCQISTVVEAAP